MYSLFNEGTQQELFDVSCTCLAQHVLKTAMNLQVEAFAVL
jgi:hypothetical protein